MKENKWRGEGKEKKEDVEKEEDGGKSVVYNRSEARIN